MRLVALILLIALAGCAGQLRTPVSRTPTMVEIIAFNDFHGNLEPPKLAIDAPAGGAGAVKVPAGGVAYLATAIDALRARNPNHIVVSAGDLIGASPLASALFLDEPTILAMNLIKLDLNAVGNHEFDRGTAELLRMQEGGCAQHMARTPCRIDPAFPGASFRFLAANVKTAAGAPLFPPTSIRTFGRGSAAVRVGFIGMTLKGTATLVSPAGIGGLRFEDEAATANALVPQLRAAGADAIVLLIHQGLSTTVGYDDRSCGGIDGDLLPILAKLDPAIDLVVSGHTHNAYVCDYGRIDPGRPFLVTSAGRYGTLLTDISLGIDPGTRRVVSRTADNVIVQNDGYPGSSGTVVPNSAFPRYAPDPKVAALVERYVAASRPLAERETGRMSGPASRTATPAGEQALGDLIADAQLAATRAASAGGAQIAFMNPGGVRTELIPDAEGRITYGQLFAAQPFGNSLVVMTLSGRQIRALLEQQFGRGPRADARTILLPSRGFRFAYDLSRPAGQRIVRATLNGEPISDALSYRVTVNSFLASGGDAFGVFTQGRDAVGGEQDLDALEAYLRATATLTPPIPDRITDLTPSAPVAPTPD